MTNELNRPEGDPLGNLIQDVFLAQGFTIKPGMTDLLPYVYRAAEELLDTFQQRAGSWAVGTFGEEAAAHIPTRRHRFLEESLELCQALGGTKEEALQLVDYVFGRPVGDPAQEVGGTMTTLAVLCRAAGLSMYEDGYNELFRVLDPEVSAKIREKHLNKPKFGPLPE